jgi:nitrile hydratase accessory protein
VKVATLEALMMNAALDHREVVFGAPWEARAFAIALSLCESGRYAWDEFRRQLIAEIGDAGPSSGAYYTQFVRALEKLLLERGLVDQAEIARRMGELASAPKPAKA